MPRRSRSLVLVLAGLALAAAGCADNPPASGSPSLAARTATRAPSATSTAPAVPSPLTTSTVPTSTPEATSTAPAQPARTPPATATPSPPPPGSTEVLAPIVAVEVVAAGGDAATARITSALPNGCARYSRAIATRTSEGAKVDVFNTIPAGQNVACTQIYGTLTNDVGLGGGFARGVEYTIQVNDVRQRFTLR